jgi:hypothetical protein
MFSLISVARCARCGTWKSPRSHPRASGLISLSVPTLNGSNGQVSKTCNRRDFFSPKVPCFGGCIKVLSCIFILHLTAYNGVAGVLHMLEYLICSGLNSLNF